jgi:hypothetical protein
VKDSKKRTPRKATVYKTAGKGKEEESENLSEGF